MHGEIRPSLDNPIIRAVEIPAASLGNSTTGDVCFITVQQFCFLVAVSADAFASPCTITVIKNFDYFDEPLGKLSLAVPFQAGTVT